MCARGRVYNNISAPVRESGPNVRVSKWMRKTLLKHTEVYDEKILQHPLSDNDACRYRRG